MEMNAFTIAPGAAGTKYRWVIVLCCMGSYFFDNFDMFILGVSMQSILGELNMTTVEGGLLSSATMLGAVLGCVFLGRLASNRGNKFSLVMCTAWIGIASVGVIFVTSFYAWFALRVLAGLGIGGIMGPIHALIWQHWSPKHRSKITGLVFSTYAIAGVIASFVAKLLLPIGFRPVFMVAGLSLVVALLCAFLIPDDSHMVPQGKNNQSKDASKHEKVKFGDIMAGNFKWITTFAVLASFCNMAAAWAMNTWIPSWLMTDRGLDLSMMTNFTMIGYFGGFVGYLVWSWIGSKIGTGRAMIATYACAAVSVVLYIVWPVTEMLLLLGPVLYFFQGGCGCLNSVLFSEAYPQRIRAYGSGTAFNMGRIGSIISPYTVALVGTSFGLTAGLMMAPAFFGVGVVASAVLNGIIKKQRKIDGGVGYEALDTH